MINAPATTASNAISIPIPAMEILATCNRPVRISQMPSRSIPKFRVTRMMFTSFEERYALIQSVLDVRDITFGRAPHHFLCICGNDTAAPAAVDTVEVVWFNRRNHSTHGAWVERYQVREAVHEADVAPVARDIDRIAAKE